ncbi:hypothetical protein COV15_00290 [Candidatus Woesearchaeota archaeon CG10_big_fil_rev_8_21_14_0_10_34_12]|nr:MAG: hypothetical protein COV15_00290 [Candidatus Woesearchaeota archaeon CG10_big_fil_rev_8_21_14_0_10_34_12]
MIIKITNPDVLNFLERTGDRNSIHQKPLNLIPGMFYLHLASSIFTRPIKEVSITFKAPAKYPGSVEMEYHFKGDSQTFRFSTNREQLCDLTAKFNCTNPELNPRKIELICQIPGKLVDKFGEGVYMRQQMRFVSDNVKNARLKLKEKRARENLKVISTNYHSSDGSLIAEGSAIVGPKEALKEVLKSIKDSVQEAN